MQIFKGVASGKQSFREHCAKKWLLEANPRNISASKISRYTVLLDTPRACPSYDFIVKAISSCIAFICLVIVAAWLSRLFRAKFSLLFRKINIKNDQFHCFYVQHIVEQSRLVMSMLTINIILCSFSHAL